ncbi:MAG: CinA family protein [Opitutales bacterium]
MLSELKERMLRPRRRTLAVAESLTCGRVQARIGLISGASEFFLGGITAYSLDQKVRHLGVDRPEAATVNSVSAAVAEQMARGVCAMFGSELGLATTGYAEPAAGVPQPFAWWALVHELGAGRRAVRSGRVDCPGAARTQVQEKVAEVVIAELVDYLRTLQG